jgi:hypothetical protein
MTSLVDGVFGVLRNPKETPLFFLETAQGVLSLKPSDEKLLT